MTGDLEKQEVEFHRARSKGAGPNRPSGMWRLNGPRRTVRELGTFCWLRCPRIAIVMTRLVAVLALGGCSCVCLGGGSIGQSSASDNLPAAGAGARTPADSVRTDQRPTVRMDGELTPGAAETLRIAHLPPLRKFAVSIGVVGNINGCREEGVSCSVGVGPQSGTRPFKTSRRGRAIARFLVPAEYHKRDGAQGTLVAEYPFVNDQRVIVVASTLSRISKHRLAFVIGQARGTVFASP
jgi:hypothetical protein